jgi:hypothetical protein
VIAAYISAIYFLSELCGYLADFAVKHKVEVPAENAKGIHAKSAENFFNFLKIFG